MRRPLARLHGARTSPSASDPGTSSSAPQEPRAACLLLAFILAACAEPALEDPGPPALQTDDGQTLSAQSQAGPVVATVALSPAAPRLGDSLVLTLTVAADAGVTVEMPVFGDALGRFGIVDYTPRREPRPDGGVELTQRYTLQSPMSGRQRIPRLRIEYVDERDGQAGVKPRELLTDELAFSVASVLPEGEVADELRPARAVLPELQGPWLARYWPWLVAGVVILAAAGAGLVVWLRRAEERARLTAYDRAMARLDRLRRAGLPETDAVDAWYVELSDIVRRYIEARFALRAPELTTEEFLLEAGRSADLKPAHRELLSDFLARCDRVKFARYSPGEDESRDALVVAERFLSDTRETGSDAPSESAQEAVPA